MRLLTLLALSTMACTNLYAQSKYAAATTEEFERLGRQISVEPIRQKFDGLGAGFSYMLGSAQNETVLPRKKGNKFIYVDRKTGKQLLTGEFDEANPFYETYALVYNNGQSGVIDLLGRWYVPLFNGHLLYVSGCSELIFETAQNENRTYLQWPSFKRLDGLIRREPRAFQLSLITNNGKVGIEDWGEKKQVVPCMYDEIVALDENGFVAVKDGKLGFCSMDNKVLIPFTYDKLTNTRLGYEDQFNALRNFALYSNKTQQWDYFYNTMNETGKAKVKKLFSSPHGCFSFKMGKFAVGMYRLDNEYNVLFADGTSLPNSYAWISGGCDKMILAVDKKGRILIVNRKGEEFVVCE